MEEEVDIKCDFQCCVCLSVGRRLIMLGDCLQIFRKLTRDLKYSNSYWQSDIMLCWECHTVLHKVMKFQQMAVRAKEVLQNHNASTLSNLKTTILNETNDVIIHATGEENIDTTILKHIDGIDNEYLQGVKVESENLCEDIIDINENFNDDKFESGGQCEDIVDIKYFHDNITESESLCKDIIDINEYLHDDKFESGSLCKDISDSNEHITDEYLHDDKFESGSLCKDISDSNEHITEEKFEPKSPYQDNNNSKDAFPDAIEEDYEILQNITETSVEDVKGNKKDTEKCDKATKAKKKRKPKKEKWYMHMRKENKQKYRLIREINEIKKMYERIELNFDGNSNSKTAGSKFKASKTEYFCRECTVIVHTESNLLDHLNRLHGSNQYVCNVCHHIFFKKHELSSHIKRRCRLYKCTVCELLFEDMKTLRSHIKNKHKKVCECLTCGLKFRGKRSFYKHHKEKHQRFECDHCGRSFRLRYSIIQHITKQHLKKYECKKCGKIYSHISTLWHHNKLEHNTTDTDCYCVECDKRFPNMYKYRHHLAKSIKHKKPEKVKVPCPDCGKVFSRKVYMTQHRNFIHLKKYNYTCEVCHTNFQRSANLIRHRKKKHEGILPPKNKMCKICGRGFNTNMILTHHMRTHTGERPNKCDICDASFAQRTPLLQHKKRMH